MIDPRYLGAEEKAAAQASAFFWEMFAEIDEGWIHFLARKRGGEPFPVGPFRAGEYPFTNLDRDEFLESLARSAVHTSRKGVDLWVCPYPQPRTSRQKGGALSRTHLHMDIDGPHKEDRAKALGALVLRSGSVAENGTPNTHLYLRLSESVSAVRHRALNTAAGEQVGGEYWDRSKRSDNDVLRIPGTLNWKDPERPRIVEWVSPPAGPTVRTWDPQRLAHLLGVDLEAAERNEKLWDQPRTRAKGWGASKQTLERLLNEMRAAEPGNTNNTLLRVAREAAAYGAPESFKSELVAVFESLPSYDSPLARTREGNRTAARGWAYGLMSPKIDTTGTEIILTSGDGE